MIHVLYNNRAFTALAMAAAFCSAMIFTAVTGKKTYDSFRIAFLGKGKNTAAVVSYKGVTKIFDLSGYYNSPVYVRKYFSENGLSYADIIFLFENEPSQYAAYISELAPLNAGKWYNYDDLYAAGENLISAGEEICFSGDGMEILCRSNALSVKFCGTEITIEPSGNRGAFVVNGDVLTQGILIDKEENSGLNNFEITLSGDGGYEFRRL